MSKFQAHKDAPDVVWLQIGYGDEGTHTWAAHQVAEDDIEQAGPYVRADRMSGQVTVKPLEWKETSHGQYLAVAPFNIGRYVVDQNPGNGAPGWMAPGPDEEWQIMNSLDAAKAAAQADFETRILAAIDTAPARDLGMLEAYDDGTEIHLSGYAGGAAPGGAWSTLTLMRCRPGQPTEFRSYTADGGWSSDGAPQAASKRIDTDHPTGEIDERS